MGTAKKYMLPLGLFKVVEFLFLLIAWTTALSAQLGAKDLFSYPEVNPNVRPAFHIAMCILCWVFVSLWLLLGLRGVTMPKHGIISAILHFILGVLLLVATSLVTDTLSAAKDVDTYLTSAAFGIMSAIILLIDSFVHIFIGLGDDAPAAS